MLCKIDVEQCFADSQSLTATACEDARSHCAKLALAGKGASVIAACKKAAASKCVWTKATKDFAGSYGVLCRDEIVVKQSEVKHKNDVKAAKKETGIKNEKKAKAAYEGLGKCKKKEV